MRNGCVHNITPAVQLEIVHFRGTFAVVYAFKTIDKSRSTNEIRISSYYVIDVTYIGAAELVFECIVEPNS